MIRTLAILLGVNLVSPTFTTQAQEALTAEDYARAERLLYTAPMMMRWWVTPNWLDGDRFWYRISTRDGGEYMLADPSAGIRRVAFDHARLAEALREASGTAPDPFALPVRSIHLERDSDSVHLQLREGFYRCDLRAYQCREGTDPMAAAPSPRGPGVTSPDGRLAAFIRDHNLWVRNLETGDETRLTSDGIEDFGYATNNAGWARSPRPVLSWSPDSRRIATFQHDARGVGMMYLVSTNVGHPELEAWRYPLPGDSVIFRIERVVIDVDAPDESRVVRLQMPPDPHRSSVCDHIFCGGGFADVEWSADGSQLFFVSTSRDHKEATVRVADPESGEVRDLFVERAETFVNTGVWQANWRLLPASSEILWHSQRDDWGHLYLYDLETGSLKNQVTGGEWNVLDVLRVDEDERVVYFVGNGRELGDPYFEYLYRVGLDGSGVKLLTPDSANHTVTLSPGGNYFIDRIETPVLPTRTVVRDMKGDLVMPLEEADISRILEIGWHPPIPFSVKARDGKTDLYGLMWRPSHFDPSKKYPIINHIYPGPSTGSVGTRQFWPQNSERALAELGFIVLALDAMGTPKRSKSFHEAYYGNMGDNGLPDHIAGMKQLAERHPWIDIDRVGIYGGSGGGYAAADAILRYPDFFKVAVAQSGNHDNRNYEDDWGEKWQGLLAEYPDGTTNYDNQANQLLAGNLKGKLLITHGMLDDNVPPYGTLLLVDALIAANKDFDLILFPNARHGLFGDADNYMTRRRWDYFVRHLLGAEPPTDYRMGER